MTTLPALEDESLIAWLHSHGLSTSCGPAAAISAYQQDLQRLLAEAAAGRREYAVNAPKSSALVLEDEARQLDTVARLVSGDMTAMTAWLPSWRWTPEMCEHIR